MTAARGVLRNNGLSIALLALFATCLALQVWCGLRHENDERHAHGEPPLGLPAYLTSGALIEATFENWESEFLQMGVFVLLSATLRQRGAAESKKLEGEDEHDADPRSRLRPDSPWPVHRGGLALALYSRSLSIALFALFLISFALHAIGGRLQYNHQALAHGQPTVDLVGYVGTSTFWFESMQNWQSEFLSVATLIVLSIFLRQKGSPESKPVHAPHAQTGDQGR